MSATTRCGASSAATCACPRWCTATCWRRWRSDRARFLPWGTRGGSSGTAGANLLNPDRGAGGERLPGKFLRSLEHGDVYRLVQPGGGYGDPLARDPEAVREDAAQGKISAAHARAAYGVVLATDGRVDSSATAALRKRRRRERGPLATEPRVQRIAGGDAGADPSPAER